MEYLENNWLSCKDKWAGYITRGYFHFGYTTTSRVEGSHQALKRGAISSRSTIKEAFNEVDGYISRFLNKQKTTALNEQLKIDVFIRSKVSGRTLNEVHETLLKISLLTDEEKRQAYEHVTECNCINRTCYHLPCIHDLIIFEKSEIPLEVVNSRWHLLVDNNNQLPENSERANASVLMYRDEDPSRIDNEELNSFSKVLAKAELQFRGCISLSESTTLIHLLPKALDAHSTYIEEYRCEEDSLVLPPSETVSKIGRPKKKSPTLLGEIHHRVKKLNKKVTFLK
ncbi:unnamed protein product [Mucor hiemalis]